MGTAGKLMKQFSRRHDSNSERSPSYGQRTYKELSENVEMSRTTVLPYLRHSELVAHLAPVKQGKKAFDYSKLLMGGNNEAFTFE